MPNARCLDDVPMRQAKAGLDSASRQSNGDAGAVLDLARANAVLEPKVMAGEMEISHSLVLRGLKSGDLSFRRLWDLDDDFWMALLVAIAQKRRIATVRTTIEVGRVA